MITSRRPVLARIGLVLLVGVGLAFVFGCGGSSGIEDGSIVGKIFHDVDTTSASATSGPESGVTVVAVRETGSLLITRSTVSDASGNYAFTDMPEGPYVIGFQKAGFKPITTQAGASANRTAVGAQIRVFVEPGRTSISPDVTLTALQPTGNFLLIITLIDAQTGQPITNATMTVGPISVTENQNGVYTLSIPRVGNPVNNFSDPPGTVKLLISADGYVPLQEPSLEAPAGQSFRLTEQMTALTVGIGGTVKVATFPGLTDLTTIVVTVLNNTISGTTDGNGNWLVPQQPIGTPGVPESTPEQTRQVSILFSNPDLVPFTLANVTTPFAGTKTITTPVIMQRITVDVMGQVRDSSGNSPNGPADIVTVSETGQQASIINGTYTITGVPQAKANGVTLIARVVNTSKNPPTTETSGQISIKPLSDGSAHPVFVAPDIVTTAAAGP